MSHFYPQTCVSANRMLIQDGVYDEFCSKFAAEVKKFVVGDGMQEGVTQGPLINERGLEKVSMLLPSFNCLTWKVRKISPDHQNRLMNGWLAGLLEKDRSSTKLIYKIFTFINFMVIFSHSLTFS